MSFVNHEHSGFNTLQCIQHFLTHQHLWRHIEQKSLTGLKLIPGFTVVFMSAIGMDAIGWNAYILKSGNLIIHERHKG